MARDEGAESAERAAFLAAQRSADHASIGRFEEALYTLHASSVERSRTAAETVQKAAATIATVYTTVLAVAFSVTDNPLPAARAIPAALFLGAAVVLSTAYVAFLSPAKGSPAGLGHGFQLDELVVARVNAFSGLVSPIVERRARTLRASVAALGVGLALIIAPFVELPAPADEGATTEGSADELTPAWPDPPTDIDSIRLAAILYEAQVAEVAEARGQPAAQPDAADRDIWVLVGGIVVGVIVVTGAALTPLPARLRNLGRKVLDRG